MVARKGLGKSCAGCGAGLRPGVDRCPLCGATIGIGAVDTDLERYQSDLRKLRGELKKLRKRSA